MLKTCSFGLHGDMVMIKLCSLDLHGDMGRYGDNQNMFSWLTLRYRDG